MDAALEECLRRLEAQQRVHLPQCIGDRRSRGLDERPARVLLVDEARLDVKVPGALRALRIDALQVDAVRGEGELAELLGLVHDDLVDADFLDRDHVVTAVLDAFEPL